MWQFFVEYFRSHSLPVQYYLVWFLAYVSIQYATKILYLVMRAPEFFRRTFKVAKQVMPQVGVFRAFRNRNFWLIFSLVLGKCLYRDQLALADITNEFEYIRKHKRFWDDEDIVVFMTDYLKARTKAA